MYFKVEISSETGNKIAQLLSREDDCIQAALKFAKKWGFKDVVLDVKNASGGIKYLIHPTAGLGRVSNLFSPLPNDLRYWLPKRTKAAKVVRDGMAILPTISMQEWNNTVLNSADSIKQPKINFTLYGRYFLFYITYGNILEYLNADCEWISEKEVYELLNKD